MSNTTINSAKQKDFKQMALEAVRNINVPAAYILEYQHEDLDEVEFQVRLDNKQVEEVRAIIATCEAEGLSVGEYFEEHPTPEYLQVEADYVYPSPVAIHLDKVHRLCDIRIAMFNENLRATPDVIDTSVWLPEDTYVELLEWQMTHRTSTFFDLYGDYAQLYDRVYDAIRNLFSMDFVSPYDTPLFAVELTGVKQMAFDLCGEVAMCDEIFYSDANVPEHTILNIEDRVLGFFYERWEDGEAAELVNVYNVDAMAVEELLGVTDYKGIFEVVRERFGDKDGVERFADFLKESNLSFDFKNYKK